MSHWKNHIIFPSDSSTFYFGLKLNFCPPAVASNIKPLFDKVKIATP